LTLCLVPWLYPSEINSLEFRTQGAAIATATNWITNFIVVQITPPGISNIGWKYYIIYTVFNFAFMPIVYFFYPETANRSLEDLDLLFEEFGGLFVQSHVEATGTKNPYEGIRARRRMEKTASEAQKERGEVQSKRMSDETVDGHDQTKKVDDSVYLNNL